MAKTTIIVDIKNEPEVLQLILDTIPFLPGWTVSNNVTANKSGKLPHWQDYRHHTARYFVFNIEHKEFAWFAKDEHPIGTGIIVADTPFKMSHVLDYIFNVNQAHDKKVGK